MVQVARFRVGQNLHQSRTTRPDAEDLAAEWVRAVEGWYGEVAQFPATEAAVTNYRLVLQKRSIRRFVITEKAPTKAFSWLKAATTAFTFKTLLRHYANQTACPL